MRNNFRSKVQSLLINEILIYTLLAIAIIVVASQSNLKQSLIDLDEIWNYQFARRILYGFIPYKDFIMLPLPFSAQLNGWLLSIFGDKLITMRWIASFMAAISGLVAFRIFSLIGKNHLMAFFYTAFFLSPFFFYPKNNYNWFAILFLLIALLLELEKVLCKKRTPLCYEVWIGITLGFATITKQNVGLAGLLGSYIFLIYYAGNLCSRNLAKSAVLKFLGWASVVFVEILYLSRDTGFLWLLKNMYLSLTKFAGYASTSYLVLFSEGLIVAIFAVLIPLVILVSLIKGMRSRNEMKKNITILIFIYAIANFIIIIPISDWLHLMFGMPITIIALSTAFRSSDKVGLQQKIVTILILLLIICSCFLMNLSNGQKISNEPELRHYEKIDVPLELREYITDLDILIKNDEASGIEVYFLNYQAALYLIPIDKFAYKYDDIIGEGSLGETETIYKLESSDNNITAIIRGIESEKNWQETSKIEDYVRNCMTYRASIHGFDIYSR